MTGANRKIEAGRQAIYPVAVIIIGCPQCGAIAGDKCIETWGGKTFRRAQPHRLRIEDSKPKSLLRHAKGT